MRSTPVHPGLLAIVLLASACNSSPTEPSAPSVGFNAMSLMQCDGGAKVFNYPEFQYRQTGSTFDMTLAGVGKAHGTIKDNVWGTFTITLDSPCGGSGSGFFQLSGSSHGPPCARREASRPGESEAGTPVSLFAVAI